MKLINSLESEEWVILDNLDNISEEILGLFRKLYSNPAGETWKMEGLQWSPISRESAAWLDQPFSEEEVRLVVFQLNKEKAPGPDGFSMALYQECWDEIKEDLLRVFVEFHSKGLINKSTNATFITLVPKKKE